MSTSSADYATVFSKQLLGTVVIHFCVFKMLVYHHLVACAVLASRPLFVSTVCSVVTGSRPQQTIYFRLSAMRLYLPAWPTLHSRNLRLCPRWRVRGHPLCLRRNIHYLSGAIASPPLPSPGSSAGSAQHQMPREDGRDVKCPGSHAPRSEGPDLEAGAHASVDDPDAHQHSHSEERSPLVRQEAGASTSGAPDQVASAGASDVQLVGSGAAIPPEAEGAIETVDGDLVRASAARQMCKKNTSPPA